MKSFIKAVAGAALAVAAVTSTASAQAGNLNFVGSVNVSDVGGNLFLDFQNPILAVQTVSGVFSPAITPFVTTGTINDVTVSGTGCFSCPVNPFVQIGGYTFNLQQTPNAPAGPFNFGPVQLTQSATGTTASLSVTGTASGPNLAAGTPYIGLFTAQFTGETPAQVFASVGADRARTVGFSAEFTTVPEPSTYVLMAAGLAALGVVARRRRTA